MINKLKELTEFSRRALQLLASHRRRTALFVLLSVATALTEGVGITMLVPILESVGNGGMFTNVPILGLISSLFDGMPTDERLRVAAGLMFAVVLVRGALSFAVSYGAVALPRLIAKEMADRAYGALMRASFAFLASENAGRIQTSIISLPSRVATLLTHFANILVTLCVIAVYLVLMLAISWEMTLASLIFLAVASEAIKRTTHARAHGLGATITEKQQRLNQIVYESLNGMRLIHLSVAGGMMDARWKGTTAHALSNMLALDRVLLSISPILAAAAGTLICALIFMTSFAPSSDAMVGTVILFMFLLFRLLAPISSLNAARASIQGDMHALNESERFHADIERSAVPDGTKECPSLRDGIRFASLSFGYPNRDGLTLSDIDTIIPKGSMTAIVGPSGAGKSTLVGLVTRFYDPTQGSVLIDGTDLRELRIASWRTRVGMVSQDVVIFNDTVLNNIRFGRENATLDQVEEAIRLAAADEFIAQLPDGLNTFVGERGTRLSGGQQQRIALARAILADPDLLILDEATSHLDSITERAIQDAVEMLRRDRTVIVIAHRLSTIRRADRIIVMESGRMVEAGTHDELLALRGRYADLIEHQRLDLVDETPNQAYSG